MLKKRIIFTLLYDQGTFVLSRNFRLQKVGDLSWLKENYDFSRVAFSITFNSSGVAGRGAHPMASRRTAQWGT